MSMFGKGKLDLQWKGKAVSVNMDMALLRVIQHQVKINSLFALLNENDYVTIADLVSVVFIYGGLNVSPEEVYEYMFEDGNDNSMLEVFTITRVIINGCFPSQEATEDTGDNEKKTR